MSRTYRRKTGDRPWATHGAKDEHIGRYQRWMTEEEAIEDFEKWSRIAEMDRRYGYSTKSLKWATNRQRRANKRMDLSTVYKAEDYDSLDIHDRKRDYKHLVWVYC